MEDRIKELNIEEEIIHLNNLIKCIDRETNYKKELNIDKGNKLLRLNLLTGIAIGSSSYFFLNVSYRYLTMLCIIAITLIFLIFIRVKYVIDNLEKFKNIAISDLRKKIEELEKKAYY